MIRFGFHDAPDVHLSGMKKEGKARDTGRDYGENQKGDRKEVAREQAEVWLKACPDVELSDEDLKGTAEGMVLLIERHVR